MVWSVWCTIFILLTSGFILKSYKGDIGADLGLFIYIFNVSQFFKKKNKRREKERGCCSHFKKQKICDKFELQLSTEITFDSGIEMSIIIYQIEPRINLHNMI